MSRVQTTRINYALGGILKVAPNLTDSQRTAMKPILGELVKLVEDDTISNEIIHRYASAVLVLGQSLMRYCESLGNPQDKDREEAVVKYAHEQLREAGLLPTPRTKQKFMPAEEEVTEAIPAEVKEEVEAEEESNPPPKKKVTRRRKPRAKK